MYFDHIHPLSIFSFLSFSFFFLPHCILFIKLPIWTWVVDYLSEQGLFRRSLWLLLAPATINCLCSPGRAEALSPLLIALFGWHCWILDPWNWILLETLSFLVMGSVRQSYCLGKSALESQISFHSLRHHPHDLRTQKDQNHSRPWVFRGLEEGLPCDLRSGDRNRGQTAASGVRGDKAWQEGGESLEGSIKY